MPVTETQARTVNGIDVEALRGVIEGIRENPAAGLTRWRVSSQWRGGTRSDHHVDGCEIGGRYIARPFTIRADDPREIGGTDQYPNPQEYLLAGLNSCMMAAYAMVAALAGVNLTKLEVETSGDIDLQGFLQLDPSVKPGYESLRYVVRVSGDGTPEQFRKIHETVQATSPNRFNLANPIRLEGELRVE